MRLCSLFCTTVALLMVLGGDSARADSIVPDQGMKGEIVTTKDNLFGSWTYKLAAGGTGMIPTGNFSSLLAQSVDTLATPAVDKSLVEPTEQQPLTYIGGLTQTYSTDPTSRTGTAYMAADQTKASTNAISITPASVTWTAAGTTLSLLKTGQAAPPGEFAAAQYDVRDPVTFNVVPGSQFQVTYNPGSDWRFVIQPPGPGDVPYIATMQSTGSASTPLSSLDLFDWSITASSANPGVVSVFFSSLGVEDPAVESAIKSRYSYDSTTGTYNFDSTNFSLTGTFTIPTDYSSSTINITADYGDLAQVTTVPEPYSVVPLGIGLLGLLSYTWCRRRATATT